MLIKSSRYVLGVRSPVGTKLRLLLESTIETPPVDGLIFGESGGLGSMGLALTMTSDAGRIFEVLSAPPPITVVPVPPPRVTLPAL